jgi:hypothetical protein
MTSGNKSSRQDNSFIKSGPSLVGLTSDERSSDGKYEDRRGKGMPINKEDIAAWEEALDSLEDFEEQVGLSSFHSCAIKCFCSPQQERAIERQLSHQSNWNEGGDQQTKDPAMHGIHKENLPFNKELFLQQKDIRRIPHHRLINV